MDEQRRQAYLTLIDQLLRCEEGEALALLQHHAELVDEDLLAVMVQAADDLEQQGEPNAEWLRQLARQLAAGWEEELPDAQDIEPSVQESLAFLAEVLQRIADCRGDARQIDPFLREHQQQLNNMLLQTIPIAASRWFNGDTNQQHLVAVVFDDFGTLIAQFPLGNREINLELAITAYRQALQVFTREAFPEDWARTQSNLAVTYHDRIRGERAENLEQAIQAGQQALRVYTREAFPEDRARTQSNLAVAYYDRIRGERAENLEQAIQASQQALRVYTRKAFPEDWAGTQHNLAVAYRDRIRGERAENLEQAIQAGQQALQVFTREAFPEDWAGTQHNLAAAYYDRIRGKRAENLEQAIQAYQQALQVRTRENFPVKWAGTQHNLAVAYYDRIRGERAENLEQAIQASQQALRVYTREAFPEEWAGTQNTLANAYGARIRGERAENLEQAIQVYQQALQVRTREAFPEEWARMQNNLAAAYGARIRGERAENLEQAIQAYQQALQVFTREAFPERWAGTQNNLANAYGDRIRGERAENLEQAIQAYQQALQVRTRETFPEEWAMTQSNLANAYRARIRGERAENLERAIQSCQQALQVYTREAFPERWAGTQNNLANAYGDRIRGERAENLEQAIQAYRSSLEIYRPEAFPRNSRRAARSLGDLYFAQRRWTEAATAYRQALQAAEILYQSASFLDNQATELAETGDLHHSAAYALTQVGDLQTAVLTLERGRARGLSDALARDRADLEQLQTTAPDQYDRYQQAAAQQRQIEDHQRALGTRPAAERHGLRPDDLRWQLAQAQQELQDAIAAIRQVPGYAGFLAPPDFKEIVSALPPARSVDPDCGGEGEEPGALVYLVTTEAGSLALVVAATHDAIGNPTATVEPLWLNDLSQDSLRKLLIGTSEASGGWFRAYSQRKGNGAAWWAAIDRGTAELWDGLMAPLSQCLTARGVQRAILIPTGYLGLLPLHAAWTSDLTAPSGRCYAFDRLHFSYAPNARSLKVAQAIARRTPPDSLLAIDEPTHSGASPLPNSQREIDAAIATFPRHQRLRRAQATTLAVRDALPHYAVWHFSCHGFANMRDPLHSGLALANTDFLFLRDILALRLSGVRLAVLSACETGLPGTDLPDEVVSLPAGLLQAGVAGVVASLWSVFDFSTMLLLTRFHDYWRIEGLAADQALRRAQQWMRDTTNREKLVHFQCLIEGARASVVSPEGARLLYGELDDYDEPDRRSFAHPYHWAAFSYVGV